MEALLKQDHHSPGDTTLDLPKLTSRGQFGADWKRRLQECDGCVSHSAVREYAAKAVGNRPSPQLSNGVDGHACMYSDLTYQQHTQFYSKLSLQIATLEHICRVYPVQDSRKRFRIPDDAPNGVLMLNAKLDVLKCFAKAPETLCTGTTRCPLFNHFTGTFMKISEYGMSNLLDSMLMMSVAEVLHFPLPRMTHGTLVKEVYGDWFYEDCVPGSMEEAIHGMNEWLGRNCPPEALRKAVGHAVHDTLSGSAPSPSPGLVPPRHGGHPQQSLGACRYPSEQPLISSPRASSLASQPGAILHAAVSNSGATAAERLPHFAHASTAESGAHRFVTDVPVSRNHGYHQRCSPPSAVEDSKYHPGATLPSSHLNGVAPMYSSHWEPEGSSWSVKPAQPMAPPYTQATQVAAELATNGTEPDHGQVASPVTSPTAFGDLEYSHSTQQLRSPVAMPPIFSEPPPAPHAAGYGTSQPYARQSYYQPAEQPAPRPFSHAVVNCSCGNSFPTAPSDRPAAPLSLVHTVARDGLYNHMGRGRVTPAATSSNFPPPLPGPGTHVHPGPPFYHHANTPFNQQHSTAKPDVITSASAVPLPSRSGGHGTAASGRGPPNSVAQAPGAAAGQTADDQQLPTLRPHGQWQHHGPQAWPAGSRHESPHQHQQHSREALAKVAARTTGQAERSSSFWETFQICPYHVRTRPTRLKPVDSLVTGKRKFRCETCTGILEDWAREHGCYPTLEERNQILDVVGMTTKQLNNWFCNHRRGALR